jgi:hypothetical protein
MNRTLRLLAHAGCVWLVACAGAPPPSGPIALADIVTALAFDDDGTLLVGQRDGNVCESTAAGTTTLTKGGAAVVGIQPLPDGTVVVAVADGAIRRGRRDRLTDVAMQPAGAGRTFALAADGDWVATLVRTEADTEARLVRGAGAVQTIRSPADDAWTAVAIQAGTPTRLALGCTSNKVRWYDDASIDSAGTPHDRAAQSDGDGRMSWPARGLVVYGDRMLIAGGMQPVLRTFGGKSDTSSSAWPSTGAARPS